MTGGLPAALAGILLGVVPAVQQGVSAQSPAGETRSVLRAMEAVATESPPRLDGVVLGDPAWDNAVPASGFWQTQPDEGEPSSERTEVRVVFTETTLYFGIVCYDRDAGSI